MATRTATRRTQVQAPSLAPTYPDPLAELRQTLDTMSTGGVARDAANVAAASARSDANRREQTMNAVTAAVTPQQNTSNTLSFATLMQIANDLGTEAGKGKDTQVKFDLKILEGAFTGNIDLQPNKHGQDKDDATMLAEAYVKAQTGSVIFDAKAPNQRKLISNLRKMVKLGTSPKWGMGQPLQNVNDLMTARQNLRRTATKGTKLDDAHNTLMRYATAQLKDDNLIVGPALEQFCHRKEADPRNAEEVLRAIQKMASNLKVGKVSNCPDLDNSAEVDQIIRAAGKRISAIVKAKQQPEQQ